MLLRCISCLAVLLAWSGVVHAQAMDAGGRDASGVDASQLLDASSVVDAAVVDDSVADGDAAAGCGGVDALGTCQGNVLRLCSGGVLQQTECEAVFGRGFVCALTPPLNAAQCVLPPTDGGPPPGDGGDSAPDSGISINPTRQGCSCVRPTFAEAALYSGLLVWWRPKRRRR